METNKPDTTVPPIDRQDYTTGFLEIIVNNHETLHEKEMKDAVEKDREFYESPENPGRRFNQNDQAYSQSSPKDFVETHSKFLHSGETKENTDTASGI